MVDAITLEVIRNRLESATEEMQHTLLRSSVSVIVKEGEDCSCGLFGPDGRTIAQACANPIHLGVIGPAIRAILARFPASTMREGDAFVVNDPYGGGTHIPDLIVVLPVFHDGRIVAMSAALSHHEDMGGKNPGSMPADATELFQEGLVIPPLKLYEAGVPNATLFAMIERNVRLPGNVLGDLEAELACAKVGARAILRSYAEFGAATFEAALAELDAVAERRTRELLKTIPDGTYAFVDHVDTDGVDLDRLLPIAARVTFEAGEAHVDFTGTAAQAVGPANIGYWGTVAAVAYCFRAIADPDIPSNEGCMRPIRVTVPEGTLLNPRHPAPVGIRAHTSKRIADAVMGALAKAAPARVAAANSGSLSVCSFSGMLEDGTRFACTDLVAGGMGARNGKDGIELLETDVTNCRNVPAEAFEAHYPLRIAQTRLRSDSGGAGEFRGGVGVEKVIEVTRGPVRCSFRSERHRTQPWGFAGGGPGASYATAIRRADGTVVELPSKKIFTLATGDALVMKTGGGGGYGDPLKRRPEAVLADVLDRKVSVTAAREIYGVVLAANARSVDVAATRALRDRR